MQQRGSGKGGCMATNFNFSLAKKSLAKTLVTDILNKNKRIILCNTAKFVKLLSLKVMTNEK
jgi:hypothetical protein